MSVLAFLLRASKRAVILAALAGLVSGLSGVALLAVIHAELGRAGRAPGPLALAFAGLCLVTMLTRVVAQGAMARLGQGAIAGLCLYLGRKILALPLERFEQTDRAGFLAVLTEDIAVIANALVGLPLVCINGPIVLACFAYVGWLSPAMLACGLAVLVPALLGHFALAAQAQRHFREARTGQDALLGHLRALLEGFRELKQHRPRRAAFLTRSLEPAIASVRDRTTAGLRRYALVAGWTQLAFFGFLGVALFLLPGLLHLDRQALAGLILVVLFLMPPLDVLLTWLPALARARASLAKVEALLPALSDPGREGPDGTSDRAATETVHFREMLRLEGLAYAYQGKPEERGFVLGPVDLTLRRGELVFLAGGNGSGKTTLVKLLTGLYEPHAGTIRVDGRRIATEQLEPYRQLFTVVFADGYLFESLLGLDHPGLDARASRDLVRLGLEGKVRVERGAFSTTALSQGQRRRLALLAACLEDRPICIFDEWAAHQDRHFKRVFYRELLPELKAKRKTVVVISHDEEYYDVADRILKLHNGRIAEGGRAAIGVGVGPEPSSMPAPASEPSDRARPAALGEPTPAEVLP